MSTADRGTASAPAASDLAAALREAGFVRLVATADGDALAATGLLARALSTAGIPFQASVARTAGAVGRRVDVRDDEHAVVLGAAAPGADAGGVDAVPERPASVTAFAVADALGAAPDPVLALAGAFAAGTEPGAGETADLLAAARDDGRVERRPGVGLPTADLADGLAHSTLVHAGFSGDPETAASLLADAGIAAAADGTTADGVTGTEGTAAGTTATDESPTEEAHRRLASLVALRVAGDERATARAAAALERTLRPYATPDGPFATVAGYADVLDAVVRRRPGTGVALALGSADPAAALEPWREHARAAHAALRAATTGRYDGLFVARIEDGPVGTVARLLAAFRSPEPTVLVVGDGEAAAGTTAGDEAAVVGANAGDGEAAAAGDAGDDVGRRLRDAVAAVGGEALGGPDRGYARYEGDAREFVAAFRGVER